MRVPALPIVSLFSVAAALAASPLSQPPASVHGAPSSEVPFASDPSDAPIDFARDVRPILSDKCFQCHGPDPETRAAGLRLDTREGAFAAHGADAAAIVPGSADDSELAYRIAPDFEDDLMPPESSGKSLTEAEVATLRRWIDEGASWGEHWSFQAPRRDDAARSIDAFVQARLQQDGRDLQTEASPLTLLRRAALDLTGLPPSADERTAFLASVDANGLDEAYAAAVDQFLASDRYGVHMARPWLDAARYADTHGLHLDNRRGMWPYRDWVVEALNDNMPFDQFTIEQLAGDLLPDATLKQRIASGFNRCNPSSAEGGMIAAEYLTIYAKDRADTTATVWLGLTMGCAQCHDHKYDPISQRDYYGMYAFFNSLTEEATDRNINNPVPFVVAPRPEDTAKLAGFRSQEADLTAELERPSPALDAAEAEWGQRQLAQTRRDWRVVLPERVAATGGAILDVNRSSGVISATGENPDKTTYTIDAWVPPGQINALRLDALTGEDAKIPGRATNQNFVLSHVEVFAAPSSRPEAFEPVDVRSAVATYSQANWPIEGVLDPSTANGWAGLGFDGDRSAMLTFARAVGSNDGTELRIQLHFQSVHEKHAFSQMRVAVKRSGDEGPAFGEGVWFRAALTPQNGSVAFGAAQIAEEAIGRGIDITADAAPGVAWTPEPEFGPGAVHALSSSPGVDYLVRRIWSEDQRDVELRLGSDDGIEVWLRGEKLLSKNVGRAAALDQEIVAATLEPGINELVLRIVNTGGPGAFACRIWDRPAATDLPPGIELALQSPPELRGPESAAALRLHYRKQHAPEWAAAYTAREALATERTEFESQLPTTLVSEERPMRRAAHVLMRGAYDKKGAEVTPATPTVLPPMAADLPRNRLGLAQWIVSPENPLTARVWVNRAWQHFFGRGLVATPEDFGAQGDWPTHPELLDWLAIAFVESGWDMKSMHRQLVLSRSYRQNSRVSSDLLEHDPDNALVSRGPRHRLDGEVLRDQALSVAGLLDESMGGPGVRPYQPDGVWFAVGYSRSNTVRYEQGPMDHLYRRSLYTFWKRTAPPPNLTTFDAPMRDACTVVRERTNTPLQALVTLNDPTYVEAAKFAARIALQQDHASSSQRAAFLFEHIVGRPASAAESVRIHALALELMAGYRDAPGEAAALLSVGDNDAKAWDDPAQHAAWTLVASTLLNLDEVLTKN